MSNAASKKTLIIMVAVFVLPVVLAKLALDNDWFTKGATNKGQLLAPTIDMSALLENAEPKWRLLYVMPSKCDAVCENALFSINQVWLALGKESDRAQAVVVTTASSDQTAIAALEDYPFVETLPVTTLLHQRRLPLAVFILLIRKITPCSFTTLKTIEKTP